MVKTYRGSCHCGAVRFEAEIDLAQGTARCNCSICLKTRAWIAFIPADAFGLLSGEQSLRDHQFGRQVIHHRFCGQCGVRPFAHGADPKGNKFYAVRVNCLDGVDPREPAGFAMLSRGDLRLLLSAPGGGGGAGQAMPDGRRPEPGGWNRIQLEVDDLPGLVGIELFQPHVDSGRSRST